MKILAVILIISMLVIIHEFGHYIVARAFGMRVLTFSIGFGPALFRFRPRGSETVFQVALIPVLAYVQIAGMNPREETDPHDRGSYQNASPLARFLTIAAGPLANFLAAGLVLFIITAAGGERNMPPARVGQIQADSAAAAAGLRPGDSVLRVNGAPVRDWEALVYALGDSQRRLRVDLQGGMVSAINGEPTAGWADVLRTLARETRSPRPVQLEIERAGQPMTLAITPRFRPESGRFLIGIGPPPATYHRASGSAVVQSGIVQPALYTGAILRRLGDLFHHSDDLQLMGPIGIVSATVAEAEKGWRDGLEMVAAISLQLFIFNLLPIPALDGGRLIVLGYEMVTRRRPNPRIEARVLSYSLVLMLGLFLVVTSREIWGLISGLIGRHG
jgi:regulator of sigma E protease